MLTSVWAQAALFSFMPLYALTLNLDGSRYVFIMYAAIVVLIRLFGARIPDVVGSVRASRASLAFSTLGLAMVALWRAPAGLYAGTAVLAVGSSLAFPALMTLALRGPIPPRGLGPRDVRGLRRHRLRAGPATLGVLGDALGYGGCSWARRRSLAAGSPCSSPRQAALSRLEEFRPIPSNLPSGPPERPVLGAPQQEETMKKLTPIRLAVAVAVSSGGRHPSGRGGPGLLHGSGGRLRHPDLRRAYASATFLQHDNGEYETASGPRRRFPRFVKVNSLADLLDDPAANSAGGRKIWVIEITDFEAPEAKDKFPVVVSTGVHGNERAGVEGGVRYAEDLGPLGDNRARPPPPERNRADFDRQSP